MAVQSVFNKIGFSNTNLKKTIKEKVNEKAQMYSFIGMEVSDLYKSEKVEIPELKECFEKLFALEDEISQLETELEQSEKQTKGSIVCSCGEVVSIKNKFCPQCGKPVDTGKIVCSCGNQLEKDMKFCTECGKEIGATQEKTEDMKTCICGAKIEKNQFMCMECGRKVEWTN